MTFTIRKAKAEDLEAVIKLLPDPDSLSLEKAKSSFEKMGLYSSYTLFVVLKDSALVAAFSLMIMDNLAHEGTPSGLIDDLVIASSEVSKGSIANKIMDFALEQCNKDHCYKLCVSGHQQLVQDLLNNNASGLSQHGLCFVMNTVKKAGANEPFSFQNNGIKIGQAKSSDLNEILELYKQPDMDDKVLALEQAVVLYNKMSANPHYKIYIALAEQQIVGTFALLIIPSLMHQDKSLAIVEDVMVSPKAQGKGVGKLMMRAALQLAESMDCYKLALSSNSKRDKAHSFYRTQGFAELGASFMIQPKEAFVAEPDRPMSKAI